MQQPGRKQRALDSFGLGIGGANDEVAIAKRHDRKVGADDLADAAGDRMAPKGRGQVRHIGASDSQMDAKQQQRDWKAVKIAHQPGGVDRQSPAQPLLNRPSATPAGHRPSALPAARSATGSFSVRIDGLELPGLRVVCKSRSSGGIDQVTPAVINRQHGG